jgi:hypothetical protein
MGWVGVVRLYAVRIYVKGGRRSKVAVNSASPPAKKKVIMYREARSGVSGGGVGKSTMWGWASLGRGKLWAGLPRDKRRCGAMVSRSGASSGVYGWRPVGVMVTDPSEGVMSPPPDGRVGGVKKSARVS